MNMRSDEEVDVTKYFGVTTAKLEQVKLYFIVRAGTMDISLSSTMRYNAERLEKGQ